MLAEHIRPCDTDLLSSRPKTAARGPSVSQAQTGGSRGAAWWRAEQTGQGGRVAPLRTAEQGRLRVSEAAEWKGGGSEEGERWGEARKTQQTGLKPGEDCMTFLGFQLKFYHSDFYTF